jgi:hypothetical protein
MARLKLIVGGGRPARDRRFDHLGDFLLPAIVLLYLTVVSVVGIGLVIWLDRWLPIQAAAVITVLMVGVPAAMLGLIFFDTRRR